MKLLTVGLLLLIAILSVHLSKTDGSERTKREPPPLYPPKSPSDPVEEPIKPSEYSTESHKVVTDDGYKLGIHRIPSGRGGQPDKARPVVFLQHGFFFSSVAWVITGPTKGLAFILADAGYDVWMGNFRGNIYSREHVRTSTSAEPYWDFSWHEMAKYDLPAQIDYVLNATGHEKLLYIGHSTGANVFYIMCALRPEYNDKVVAQFSLAPNAIYDKTLSLKGIMKFLARLLEAEIMFQNSNKLVTRDHENRLTATPLCMKNWPSMLCRAILYVLGGFQVNDFDEKTTSVIYSHFPSGISKKSIQHYRQCFMKGEYEEMDLFFFNYFKYNAVSPPKYDITRVKVPVYIYYSESDMISTEAEAQTLHDLFPQSRGIFKVTRSAFSHLDFLWGREAKELVFDRILSQMKIYKFIK